MNMKKKVSMRIYSFSSIDKQVYGMLYGRMYIARRDSIHHITYLAAIEMTSNTMQLMLN